MSEQVVRSLWANSRFTRFFASFTIGNIGDWFDIFALQIIMVHQWHAGPLVLGLMIFFYFLPNIVLGPMAGVLADHFSKRNLMIVTDAAAAVLTVGLIFSHSIALMLIILLVRGGFVSVNAPAQQAYIKYVTPPEQLLPASSYTMVTFQLCRALGPMLGAGLVLISSPRACLAINAASFVLSVLILMTLPYDSVQQLAQKTHLSWKNWCQQLKAGAQFVHQHRFLRYMVMLTTVWMFCSLLRQSQLAIFLAHVLPTRPEILGVYMSLEGVGAVLTGFILTKRKRMSYPGRYMALGFGFLAAGVFVCSIFQTNWPVLVLCLSALLVGFGTGINLVVYGYFIKKETPEVQIGCVTGLTNSLLNAALGLGTVSSGLWVMAFGIREVYVGLAVILSLLVISGLLLLKLPGQS